MEDRDSAYEFLLRVNEAKENEEIFSKESKEKDKEAQKDKIRIGYFFFFMKNLKIQELAESTTVPSVRKSRLEDYEIELPTLTQQKIIEEKLLLILEIIKKRSEELLYLDNLIKARFVEMFGEPIRNTQNRKTTEFINVVKMQRGFDLPVQERRQDGGIPVGL